MATSDSTTKLCITCGNEYPRTTEYFPPAKRNTDGLRGQCRNCFSIYQREYTERTRDRKRKQVNDWRDKNREKMREFDRKYYSKNSEKRKLKSRIYYSQHSDELNEKRRQKYKDNPEYYRSRTKNYAVINPSHLRNWRKNNPVKVRLQEQRRKALENSVLFDFSELDRKLCIEYFNGCCAVCGRPLKDLFGELKVSMDHWIPITKGGGTTRGNIVPLCFGKSGCNNSKSDKDPRDWLLERYGKRKSKTICDKIKKYFDWVSKRMAQAEQVA